MSESPYPFAYLDETFCVAFVDAIKWNTGVEVLLARYNLPGQPSDHAKKEKYVGRITWEPAEMDRYLEPSFRLRQIEAQALMNGLWAAGLRPSEGTGSAGQLSATQKHLEDTRKLLFSIMEIDKP